MATLYCSSCGLVVEGGPTTVQVCSCGGRAFVSKKPEASAEEPKKVEELKKVEVKLSMKDA